MREKADSRAVPTRPRLPLSAPISPSSSARLQLIHVKACVPRRHYGVCLALHVIASKRMCGVIVYVCERGKRDAEWTYSDCRSGDERTRETRASESAGLCSFVGAPASRMIVRLLSRFDPLRQSPYGSPPPSAS